MAKDRIGAIGLMCAGSVLFAVNDGLGRVVADEVGVAGSLWARYAFCLLALLLWFGPRPVVRSALAAGGRSFLFVRSILPAVGSGFAIASFAYMPVPEAVAIIFLSPLIVMLAGRLLLKENVSSLHWLGAAVTFLGVVVVVRPTAQNLGLHHLLPLGTTVCFASYQVMTRIGRARFSSQRSMVYLAGVGALAMTAVSLVHWIPPSGAVVWSLMALSGALYALSHSLVVRALARAEASLLAPFSNIQLLASIPVGAWLLSQAIDRFTIAGCFVVIAGAVIVAWSDRRQRLQ